MNAYEVKANVEQLRGNSIIALENFERFHILHDSIQKSRLNNDIQDLQLKYESNVKQGVIDKQNLLLEKSKNQRNLLFYGLATLVLFSLWMYSKYKDNQKIQNEKIKSLKQEQKLLAIDYLVKGQEEERKRIARDLHDGLGGLLTTVKLHIQNIHKEISIINDMQLFDKAENLIENACNEVRRIAHDMIPDAL